MILRALVCIPTYNNEGTIEQVVTDALEHTTLSILVVDDGSKISVQSLLRNDTCKAAIASGRLHVLRLQTNQGKGVALQTAFQWSVENGFTHLLSIDGDGQHLLSEAKKLLDKSVEQPWSLIIGKRKFETASDVPGISKFGRKFSNFWVQYQTGQGVQDSQSGYRLYPLFHVQNLKFWTKRYDFEIEVLIRLLWKGIAVHEVEIDVYYPPENERVSHFDKFWDNVRISLLNTLLVVVSLLKFNHSPRKSGVAFGIGIFIGASPLYGFHTLLGAAAAFFFRLNALMVFLGTNISFPPIAVFLIPLEIATGRRLLATWNYPLRDWQPPKDFESLLPFARDHILEWCLGAVIVGFAFAVIGGFAMAFLNHRLQKSTKNNWTGKTRGGKLGNGFLIYVLRFCGRHVGYAFLFFVAPYFYLFAPRARRGLNEYWRVLEPKKGWWVRQFSIIRQMYRFGQVLMDRGFQSFHPLSQFQTRPHGMEQILEPLQKKQPLILASAHVGGWDLASAFLNQDGLRSQFHMVHYQSKDLTFEKVAGRGEALSHVQSLLTTEEPVLKIREMLDRGEPVGFMADRATNTHVELVPFMGKIAPMDVRPYRIAAACGARVLFTFGFKGRGNEYDLYAFPSFLIEPRADRSRALQLRDCAASYAEKLEELVRKYPEQWFNFYPLFSSVPQAPPGVPTGAERCSLWQEWTQSTSEKHEQELNQ
jgi:predicted LPLAT superfamily acyltransferase/glycosyltransferase involved in cell wall biosynthesis